MIYGLNIIDSSTSHWRYAGVAQLSLCYPAPLFHLSQFAYVTALADHT
jgi:hypothetical protein